MVGRLLGWVEEGELRKVVTSEVLALRRGKGATPTAPRNRQLNLCSL